MSSEGSVFRWSGDNTERARSKAAAQLLKHLKPLEESGQRYHLIGHSHGGSVIWSALRTATARKQPLHHLGSWSTVGTPFLQHRSRSPWNVINIAYMLFAAVLLFPAGKAFWALGKLPYDALSGKLDGGLVMKSDQEAGYVTAMLRVPILKAIELMGVGMPETEGGVRFGSFDPESGQSIGRFMFGTVEGWIIIGAILLFGYITLLLGSCFLSPVSEGLRIGWEKRSEQRAFREYSTRWLGIWTQDDEAINGLRATMELSMSFVGNLVLRERVYLSDLISLPSRPLYRLIAPLYNRVLRRMLDSKIREIVVKTAQGNDRPAAHVVAVSPHPILPPPSPSVPPLPNQVRVSIRDRANQHAYDLGPKLRGALGSAVIDSRIGRIRSDAVGQRVGSYVVLRSSGSDRITRLEHQLVPRERATTCSSTSAELIEWFNEFKHLQGAEVQQSTSKLRPISNRKTPHWEKERAA